jgi:AraC-like DNA-binding protein
MPAPYAEHRAAGLERWVECAWERSGGKRGDTSRVIPDGCMDVVFAEHGGLLVVGPNTTAFSAELAPGSSALGVRLHPGCAPPLVGVTARELQDARVPAAALWGDAGELLAEALEGAPDIAARRALLLGWLGRRARGMRPDPLVRTVARRLVLAPETRIGTLARELGVGERRLHRRIVSQVGYGPKRLARVLRLRRALDEARAGTGLAETAFAAGYADQAHFTNDCTGLAGAPPAALLAA